MNLCPACENGKVLDMIASMDRMEMIYEKCSICGGTGVLVEKSATISGGKKNEMRGV